MSLLLSPKMRGIVRVKTLRTLIDELRKRPMSHHMTAYVLCISHAGAKNYMRDLRVAGIVDFVGGSDELEPGTDSRRLPVFGIVATDDVVAKFLADAEAGILPRRNSRLKAIPASPRRSRCQDLGADPVRVPFKAFRHPLDIAFFGPAAEVRP